MGTDDVSLSQVRGEAPIVPSSCKQPSTDGQDEADTLRAELRELKHMRRAEVSHPGTLSYAAWDKGAAWGGRAAWDGRATWDSHADSDATYRTA